MVWIQVEHSHLYFYVVLPKRKNFKYSSFDVFFKKKFYELEAGARPNSKYQKSIKIFKGK